MSGELSTFESRSELPIGYRMPPPFHDLVVAELLSRTARGYWLYRLEIDYVPGPEAA